MDLTDDEDDYVSSSKALDEGELFKMKSVARRERESRLSSYDLKMNVATGNAKVIVPTKIYSI